MQKPAGPARELLFDVRSTMAVLAVANPAIARGIVLSLRPTPDYLACRYSGKRRTAIATLLSMETGRTKRHTNRCGRRHIRNDRRYGPLRRPHEAHGPGLELLSIFTTLYLRHDHLRLHDCPCMVRPVLSNDLFQAGKEVDIAAMYPDFV